MEHQNIFSKPLGSTNKAENAENAINVEQKKIPGLKNAKNSWSQIPKNIINAFVSGASFIFKLSVNPLNPIVASMKFVHATLATLNNLFKKKGNQESQSSEEKVTSNIDEILVVPSAVKKQPDIAMLADAYIQQNSPGSDMHSLQSKDIKKPWMLVMRDWSFSEAISFSSSEKPKYDLKADIQIKHKELKSIFDERAPKMQQLVLSGGMTQEDFITLGYGDFAAFKSKQGEILLENMDKFGKEFYSKVQLFREMTNYQGSIFNKDTSKFDAEFLEQVEINKVSITEFIDKDNERARLKMEQDDEKFKLEE